MNNVIIHGMTGLVLLAAAGMARAECPQNMPTDELVDCIVVEGSGENYVEWKAKFEREFREQQAMQQETEKAGQASLAQKTE